MYKYKNVSDITQKFRAGGKVYSVESGKTIDIPVELTSGVLGVMQLEDRAMKKSKKDKGDE